MKSSDLPLPTVLTETQFLMVSELLCDSDRVHGLFVFYLMDSELLNLVQLNIFGRTDNSMVSVPAALFFFNCKINKQLNTCAIILIF